MEEELYDDTFEEKGDIVEELQLNFLDLKIEKDERLSLEDIDIFRNPKTIRQKVYQKLAPEDTLKVVDCTEDYDMEEDDYDDAFEDGDILESMQLNFLDMKIEKDEGLTLKDLESTNPQSIQQQVVEQGREAAMRKNDFFVSEKNSGETRSRARGPN